MKTVDIDPKSRAYCEVRCDHFISFVSSFPITIPEILPQSLSRKYCTDMYNVWFGCFNDDDRPISKKKIGHGNSTRWLGCNRWHECSWPKFCASLLPVSEKVLTNYFAKGSVSVSPLPHGIPTTEPAFIEWQHTIGRSLPPSKILVQKAKSNH